MRIAIREQLALLVVLATLVALAVVSIPVWIYVNDFVTGVQQNALGLTASLKAARIAAEIDLLQTTCQTIATRVLIQKAITSFYDGTNTTEQWDAANDDIQTALNQPGSPDLLQARIYSRNSSGTAEGLISVTSKMFHNITLPFKNANGTDATLSDVPGGYPAVLYPNITYTDTGQPSNISPDTNVFYANAFSDLRLTSGLFLGPLIVNETYAIVSLTVPVRANGNSLVIGYMTLLASASTLLQIRNSPEGLGRTGMTLIIGPHSQSNRFNATDPPSNSTFTVPNRTRFVSSTEVQFILPPRAANGTADRHSNHNFESGGYDEAFALADFPAVATSLTSVQNKSINNAQANLWTTNEQGLSVSVGTARPNSQFVQWVVVVEQERGEALAAITTLRNILLGCVFGTAGLMTLIIFPCAHVSVRPIRDLKVATEKSIAPPGYDDDYPGGGNSETPGSGVLSSLSEKGWVGAILRKTRARRNRQRNQDQDGSSSQRRVFKIPGKVTDRKHYITDELTELTETFNEMTDELYKQYTSLDDKVAERTRELEISKKAAEAANESKTLFIANISHELKTPLNGIMGMCAVCMEETDVSRIKQSLKTLYKSGDLLLHLLEDLLSFSKNQIGHRIGLEEKEFRLGDIRQQLLAIFDKQVRESGTHFTVEFTGGDALGGTGPERRSMETRLPALGPMGTGRLKDMCLWGDQQRILQVIINLVSNSLKFTPAGGKVDLRIRCLEEIDNANDDTSRTSSFSRSGSARAGRTRHRMGSSSAPSTSSKTAVAPPTSQQGTALAINPMEPKGHSGPMVQVRERSPTPPPPNAKSFLFEFEVEDSGPGIPEHMRVRVFEPFVQGDLGLSKKFGGTGLGLSICQQLATLMGGNITLRSTMGVGSVFTMRIPLRYVKDRDDDTDSTLCHQRASSTASSSIKSRPPSVGSVDLDTSRQAHTKPTTDGKHASVLDNKPRLVGLSHPFFSPTQGRTPSKEEQAAELDRKIAKAVAEKGSNLRVLVADDNSTNIEVVSKMLRLEHVSDVTVATDGQEALEVVRSNMEKNLFFDLIFMDIQMPNLDGLQSTRLIRKLGYSAPIVALTAFSEESNVKDCLESGMNEFLAKPIRRPALKQVLKKFATIPEEPETASLTRKTTPEKKPSPPNSPSIVPEPPLIVPETQPQTPDPDIQTNGSAKPAEHMNGSATGGHVLPGAVAT